MRISLKQGLAEGMGQAMSAALKRGRVLAIPTDTVYGLAADPFSEPGVQRIHQLKGRSPSKAFPVLVSAMKDLDLLGVVLSPELRARLETIWPAPLTMVLEVKKPFAATGGALSVAVRVPAHEALRELLATLGPLTATSANPSGGEPATTADQAARLFGDGLAFVLDGGPSGSSVPSTLVEGREDPPRVLRKGLYDWNASV
ncbi:MAG: L-threonylcarbamoyladenylate synthase [Thermoanaerobaculia bacterium]